ncbi:porin [Burkholderia plantarii]|uniref:porin n=1 Tax=Burkholderia plantarii TaxID=41899 RepID=UPI00272B8F59|nr:porin [Burkholderia plantarii]WLE62010.1 porin [Burkholderia plantarii]
MKKSVLALGAALLAVSAQPALAQGSVTLYGLVDTAVRYQTHADANGGGLVSMREGVVTPSRWGLKGAEELGGGTRAIFRLESQFNLPAGQLSTAGLLFQRSAFVGLSNDRYGTITLGRQQTPFFDMMGGGYDPLTVADYWQDCWVFNPVGRHLFTNSSVKYDGRFGALHLEGMYGFGGVPGRAGEGSMVGVSAEYGFGALSTDVGFEQNDVAGKKFQIVNVSAIYTFTPTLRVMAGWLHSQDNTGLTDSDSLQPGAAALPRVSPNRIDDNVYLGAKWQATAPLAITLVGYGGHARNAARRDGSLGSGTNYSATLLAEYALSRRTEIYGSVDFTHGSGSYRADYPGRSNQTGLAIGLRNVF